MMDMQMEVLEQPLEGIDAVAFILREAVIAGAVNEEKTAMEAMAMKKVRVDLFLEEEPVFLEVIVQEEVGITIQDEEDE